MADAALFLDVAATDRQVSYQQAAGTAPQPLRIALAWKSAAYWPVAARLGADQRATVETTAEVLRGLGHSVEEHEVGFPQSMSTNYIVRYLAGVAEQYPSLSGPDAVAACTRQMASLGRRVPAKVLRKAIAGEAKLAAKVNRIFENYDLVLTPGAVEEPLKVGTLNNKNAIRTLYSSGRKIPHFAPWNCIGQPAVSIPTGFSKLDLPVSVQLAGPPNSEATLLAVATQLEAAQPWAHKTP